MPLAPQLELMVRIPNKEAMMTKGAQKMSVGASLKLNAQKYVPKLILGSYYLNLRQTKSHTGENFRTFETTSSNLKKKKSSNE